MFAGEHIVRHVAFVLRKDVNEIGMKTNHISNSYFPISEHNLTNYSFSVVEKNLYETGHLTHYNQLLTNCTVSRFVFIIDHSQIRKFQFVH